MHGSGVFSSLLCCLLHAFLLMTAVEGLGHLALKLTEYRHSTPGKLLSGDCCDGVSGTDCSAVVCDPYFIIRITETNQRTQNVDIRYLTDTLKNVESTSFTDKIGATVNPVNNSISVWPGMVEIRITVMDNNSDIGVADGVMANLTAGFSRAKDPLLHQETEFSPVDFLNDHSTLEATINVRCDWHYTYDPFCSKHCQPQDNATGHLTCDDSGRSQCLPGWMGDPKTGCLQASCTPNPCKNGGTCRTAQGVMLCACALGFSGRLCERSLAATSQPMPPRPQMAPQLGHGSGLRPVASQVGTTAGLGNASPSPSGQGQGTTSVAGSGMSGNTGGGGGGGSGGTTGSGSLGRGTGSTGSGSFGGGNGNGQQGGSGSTTVAGHGQEKDNDNNLNNNNKNNNNSSSSSSGGDVAPIVGGVVGGLAALALLSLLLFLLIRRKMREEKVKPAEEDQVEEVTTEDNGGTPKADNSTSA